MKFYTFYESGESWDVVAESALAAFCFLVEQDCFTEAFRGEENDNVGDCQLEVEWSRRDDADVVTICMDDDPDADDLAAPGAKWDPVKRTLAMPAKSWAALYDEATLVGTSAV